MHALPAHPTRLSIGLILEGSTVPAWIGRIVESILNSDRFELKLVMTYTDTKPSTVAFRLFRCWDEQIGRLRHRYRSSPLSRQALPLLPSSCHRKPLSVSGFKSKSQEDDDLIAIKRYQLDLLICFGPAQLAKQFEAAAHYGAWYFTPDFASSISAMAATCEQLQSGNYCLTARLLAVSKERQEPHVLFETKGGIGPGVASLASQSACLKLGQAVVRLLSELWQNGKVEYLTSLYPVKPETPVIPSRTGTLVSLARRQMGLMLESLRNRDDWHIAIRHKPVTTVSTSGFLDNAGYQLIHNPKGRFLADPFMVEKDNILYTFVEDYDATKGKAMISCLARYADGSVTPPVPVLERDYHLSYPFIFEHDGNWYMLPETSGNRAIELFRATRFPYEWTFERILIKDICATDATLLQHDKRWWLFVNILPEYALPTDLSINDELYLFYADDLAGPWQAHPLNPVVSNVQQARSAGAIFKHQQMLIRPAQDCSRTYGSAVSFCRIDELSTTHYRQTVIGKLHPFDKKYIGLHTFNQTRNYEVIDLKSRFPRLKDTLTHYNIRRRHQTILSDTFMLPKPLYCDQKIEEKDEKLYRLEKSID